MWKSKPGPRRYHLHQVMAVVGRALLNVIHGVWWAPRPEPEPLDIMGRSTQAWLFLGGYMKSPNGMGSGGAMRGRWVELEATATHRSPPGWLLPPGPDSERSVSWQNRPHPLHEWLRLDSRPCSTGSRSRGRHLREEAEV